MAKIGSWLLFLSVLLRAHAFAGLDIKAVVDRDKLSLGETLTLSVVVSSEEAFSVGSRKLPSLDGFDLLREWTSQEAHRQMVQGDQGMEMKSFRKQVFSYLLQPQRQGQIRIGAVEVVVDGREYLTDPISIEVFRGPVPGQPPKPPEDEEDEDVDLFSQLLKRRMRPLLPPPGGAGVPQAARPDEAFSIVLDLDKARVYQGEQITASWYLVTSGLLRDLDTLKYPALRGFWKEDIEIATQLNFQPDVVDGRPARRALLSSSALFPIKAGKAVIDDYRIKATVITGGAFGGFGIGQTFSQVKNSEAREIEVLPLPDEGKPKDFTGAVGQFTLSSGVENTTVRAGQPLEFRIRFEGRGNAKLIDLPTPQLPANVELYDQKAEAKFFANGTSYKDFTLLLIPREPGEALIPALSVSYFDPQLHKYVTKSTEPLTLKVLPGDGKQEIPSATALTPTRDEKKPEPYAPHLDPLFVQIEPVSVRAATAVWAGIFAGVALLLVWRAARVFGFGRRRMSLSKQLQKRLKRMEALASQNQWRELGAHATNTVYLILGEISGQGGVNVSLDKLWRELPPSLRHELEAPLTKLLSSFEALSFAPGELIGDLKNPAKLRELLLQLEKLMNRAIQLHLKTDEPDAGAPEKP